MGYKQITLPITTIDAYLSDKQPCVDPDVLKVDAEGLDIKVLEGARECLQNIELIFIEAGINNTIYPNTVYNIINWLDKHGFRLFDITQTNRPYWPYTLWTMEQVFVKMGGRFESMDLLKQGGIVV